MATETRERALERQIFNAVFQKLGPKYKASQVAGKNYSIAIVESAGPGKKFENGRNLRLLGGVTDKQLKVVRNTSETVLEAAERIIDYVLNGNDTITVRPKEEQNIENITKAVTENVLAALQGMLKGGAVPQAEAPAIECEEREVPQGIQAAPKKRSEVLEQAMAKAETKEDEVKMWRTRAHLAGLPEPKLTKLGHIDGRWIRKNKPGWEAYLADQS